MIVTYRDMVTTVLNMFINREESGVSVASCGLL